MASFCLCMPEHIFTVLWQSLNKGSHHTGKCKLVSLMFCIFLGFLGWSPAHQPMAQDGIRSGQSPVGGDWQPLIQQAVVDRLSALGYLDVETLVSSEELRWKPCKDPNVKVNQINRSSGRVQVTLQCQAPRWQLQTQVPVRARRLVVVALRNLSPNVLLDANDLVLVGNDWTAVTDDAVTEIESAVGKTLARTIGQGQVITLNSLRQTAVIKNAEVVRVDMIGVGFVIGGEGVALQQGGVGDSIRIRMRSGQVLSATVVRAGLVKVELQ